MQIGARRHSRARFEEFVLDMRTGELCHDSGKVIRLPEQPFQILAMLLERPGGVVSREEIRKRLWPNDTIVEFEHSIQRCDEQVATSTWRQRRRSHLHRNASPARLPVDAVS